jgi:Fic family protein
MRRYEKTHPWLTFRLNTKEISAGLWMALGEAYSKCEHIAGVPLPPIVAQQLHQVYLAKGVLATTAIEGNTLTEEEVIKRINGELNLPESREYLGVEIDNVTFACNQISKDIEQSINFELITPALLKNMNRDVLKGLELNEGVVPGEYSLHNVGVANYLAPPREDCEYLVERICSWLNHETFLPSNSRDRLIFGIIRAILAHLYLVWIHPFGDGNGRTSRLLEFRILLTAGVPTPAAHLLSNHYNLTRQDYYRQLDRSSKTGGDPIPFLDYAVRGLIDGLRAQLDTIRQLQWTITWRDYVHHIFHDRESAADKRQRHLVIDLTNKGAVPLNDIMLLSPRLAREYANKSVITLRRDLKSLVELQLVVREGHLYRANKEIIQAFLPFRKTA